LKSVAKTMRLRILVRPWELLAGISISIVILYALALQLLFQAGSILSLFTIIALLAVLIQLRSLNMGGSYVVFILFTSVISLLLTSNLAICTTYITNVIKAFLFFLAIINCMRLRNGFKMIRYSTIIAGLVLSYMLFFQGVITSESMRISASEGINENIVAASITISIVLTLYDITLRKKELILYFDIAAIVFMCSAVLLTGTRKSFIAIVLLLVFYMVFVVMPKNAGSSKSHIRRFIVAIVGIAAVLYYIKYGIDQTNMGERFRNIGYQGDRMRVFYYAQAYRIFREHPLFGTGWGGFAAQIGMYSHSTYGELIANTGIMGCILFFVQYYGMLYKGTRNIRLMEKGSVERSLSMIAILSILMILVLGVGTVVFYEINLTLCVGVAYALLRGNTLFGEEE